MKYDVVIVGAGPMGIYTAYEFMAKRPDLKVLLIDKGHDIYHRNCPILDKKIKLLVALVVFPLMGLFQN